MSSMKMFLRRAVEKQWVRFLIFSVPGTMISFPLYWLLSNYTDMGAAIASPISNVTAQFINFLPQKLWTFGDRALDGRTLGKQGPLFLAIVIFFVIAEMAMIYSLTNGLGWWPTPAWIVTHLITAPTRFTLEKMLFKQTKSPGSH